MAEITKPPQKPIITINVAIPALCSGVNGVIHHMAEPINIMLNPPPIRPSNVLLGLTKGATLVLPNKLPKRVATHRLVAQLA